LPEGWARSVLLTLAFSSLVAAGVADRGSWFPLVVIGTAALGMGSLYLIFPHGMHFAFGTSAGLALYACLFVVIGRAGFPDAEPWARAPAFLLPVLTFLLAVWSRRQRLTLIASRERAFDVDHLPRMARWLLPVWLVGTLSMSLPINRLDPMDQSWALLAAMFVIGVMVASSVRGVVLLLTDMALIMKELGDRAGRVAVPIFAFLTMYGVLVVLFASLYRISDGLSVTALFSSPQGPASVTFPDALYFSLVTQATVGYGDLTPQDDGVRLLASTQVVLGQVLLLFGFAEIMRTRQVSDRGDDKASPRNRRDAAEE
jgi:hypothetical protein